MATSWTLQRFSRSETLRSIAPSHLFDLLKPYRRYLIKLGVDLPKPRRSFRPDFNKLVKVFLTPDPDTPRDLIDALFFVDEMSTPVCMDILLEEAKRQHLKIDEGIDFTPADVAVQVWLLDRAILERKHAEHHVLKVRSLEYYQMDRVRPPRFTAPSAKALEAISDELDIWFVSKRRGPGSKVFMGQDAESVWFLVRHAEPLRREESMEGVKTSNLCFRPVTYDTVIYVPALCELRINARLQGEKDLYRRTFGKHLFGDEYLFPGIQKYTLDPLREDGADSLACFDIDGIEEVNLTEMQLLHRGARWEIVTRKSDDLFALFESLQRPFPASGEIKQAKFKVRFKDEKTPRTVVIKPPNVIQFGRAGDCVPVERWLQLRKFIKDSRGEGDEKLGEVPERARATSLTRRGR
jgi:hypothetical protein